jgi:hypothetical protein
MMMVNQALDVITPVIEIQLLYNLRGHDNDHDDDLMMMMMIMMMMTCLLSEEGVEPPVEGAKVRVCRRLVRRTPRLPYTAQAPINLR